MKVKVDCLRIAHDWVQFSRRKGTVRKNDGVRRAIIAMDGPVIMIHVRWIGIKADGRP